MPLTSAELSQKLSSSICQLNDFELNKKRVEQGADVNYQSSPYTQSPLHKAANYGRWWAVEFLISKGANLELKAEYGRTPLIFAVFDNNKNADETRDFSKTIRILAEAGADVNAAIDDGTTVLMYAVQFRSIEDISLLLPKANINAVNKQGKTALIDAIQRGHLEIVRLLLLNKADPNIGHDEKKRTPIQIAANSNFSTRAMIELLIQHGATTDVLSADGSTELMYAARAGDLDWAMQLVRAGVDVNAQNKDGVTALMIAAQRNDLTFMQFVLTHHADLNKQDSKGFTALFYTHKDDTTAFLINYGANVNLPTVERKTILHQAISGNYNLDLIQNIIGKMRQEILNLKHQESGYRDGETALWIAASRWKQEKNAYSKSGKKHKELAEQVMIAILNAGGDPSIVCDRITVFDFCSNDEQTPLAIRKLLYFVSDNNNDKSNIQRMEEDAHCLGMLESRKIFLQIFDAFKSSPDKFGFVEDILNRFLNIDPFTVLALLQAILLDGFDFGIQNDKGEVLLHRFAKIIPDNSMSNEKHSQYLSIYETLSIKHALLYAQAKNGCLPIHHTAENGNEKLFKLMVENSPSLVNAQAKSGFTPVHFAAMNGHIGIIQACLEQYCLKTSLRDNNARVAFTVFEEHLKNNPYYRSQSNAFYESFKNKYNKDYQPQRFYQGLNSPGSTESLLTQEMQRYLKHFIGEDNYTKQLEDKKIPEDFITDDMKCSLLRRPANSPVYLRGRLYDGSYLMDYLFRHADQKTAVMRDPIDKDIEISWTDISPAIGIQHQFVELINNVAQSQRMEIN